MLGWRHVHMLDLSAQPPVDTPGALVVTHVLSEQLVGAETVADGILPGVVVAEVGKVGLHARHVSCVTWSRHTPVSTRRSQAGCGAGAGPGAGTWQSEWPATRWAGRQHLFDVNPSHGTHLAVRVHGHVLNAAVGKGIALSHVVTGAVVLVSYAYIPAPSRTTRPPASCCWSPGRMP